MNSNKCKNWNVNVCLLVVMLSVGCLLVGCGGMTETEIEQECGSGVVLVMNSGYYEVVLSNGESVYFSSYDSENGLENLTFDEDSIVSSLMFGTGFFVSEDGKLVLDKGMIENVYLTHNISPI